MQKGLKGIATLLAVLAFTSNILAQSPAAPGITLIVEPNGITTFDPIQNPGGHPFDTDTALIRLVLDVQDTSNIATIHVKLGNTQGGSQFIAQDFLFDASTGLPTGTSYRRYATAIYIGLGSYSGFNSAYATVTLENSSGVSSTVSASFQ